MVGEKIADVFKAIGQPIVTYVKRDSGKLEKLLADSLDERGQLCLVTGPSKTGKTTLYNEVLRRRAEIPLIVRCDRTTTVSNIWRSALESVNFARVTQRITEKTSSRDIEFEAGGDIGWAWLAGITARFRGSGSSAKTEAEQRELVLADSGPDLLIPILRRTNYILVIEDFHYLSDEEKITLFQQWKRFTDSEISVIVLGTTHRAIDIANSNRDLVGRISQIDVGHWSVDDLLLICKQGFEYLDCRMGKALTELICLESVGLPIIVQQVCLNIFNNEQCEFVDQARERKIVFSRLKIERSLHLVSRNKYSQFETYYSTLIRGPREKARKFRTYELVLACFTLDPIQFCLSRREIDTRMGKLKLPQGEMPPAASLNSTLGALRKFQEKRDLDLLEWRPREEVLYIIEPAFLFYVRWRARDTSSQPLQLDLFEKLIIRLSPNLKM